MQQKNNIHIVVALSGGKDSTAMAIRLKEEGWHVDEYVFCDTGKEFPEMYEHIENLENYLGITITKLTPPRSFDFLMNEYVKVKGGDIGGSGYGWPQPHRWCSTQLKTRVSNLYLKQYCNVVEYQGIAIDEWDYKKKSHRTSRKSEGKRVVMYPLCLWAMTEGDCLQYCYDRGFDWGGLYQKFERVSCFCCPHQQVGELKTVYVEYPELWAEMERMDNGKEWMFKQDRPLSYWTERFKEEIDSEHIAVKQTATGQLSFDFVRQVA